MQSRSIATLLAGVVLSALGAAPARADTALTWLVWGNTDAETKVWQQLADMVHQKHPDITVTVQTAAWLDYWTKLPTLAAGGQLPDIVTMQSLRAADFASILEPLEASASAAKLDLKAFEPTIVDGLSVEGHLYALPYDIGPWLVMYNKDLFNKAGLPLPKPGWTRDEFLKAAKALTRDNQYGFAVTSNEWLPFMLSSGAAYVKDGQLDLAGPAMTTAFQAYADLAAKDKVAPPVAASGTAAQVFALGRFTSGSLGMMVDGPWDLVNIKDQAKFTVGFATIPAGSAGSITQVAGSGFGVARTSPHKAAAFAAIAEMTGPEAERYLVAQGRAFPARTAEQDGWYKTTGAGVQDAEPAMAYSLKHSVPYAVVPNMSQLNQLTEQYFPLAFNGSQPAAQVLSTVQNLASQ